MNRLIMIMILVLFTILNVFAEDMSKYLIDTEKLAQDGKNEEALTRFIWLYDHSLEHDPAFSGVRLSYLLGYWKDLAGKYPPALKALQDIRDRETELIKSGKGTSDTFREVVSINRELLDNAKSIELFEFLDKNYPEFATRYWNSIDSQIIAARKFELVKKYLPDPMKKFNLIVFIYKTEVLSYETSENVELLKKCNEDDFVDETLNLITAVKAIDGKEAADQIRKKAFEILPDPRLK